MRSKILTVLLVLGMSMMGTVAHAASTIILSGSDTISFHDVTSEARAAYRFLSNNETGAVLVVNDFGAGPGYGGGGFGALTTYASSLAGVTLSDYDGIMFASPFTCCSDPGGFVVGYEGALAAYNAAGGNLYIEDYLGDGGIGGSAYAASWTTILGFDGSAGEIDDTGCTGDPGVPTALGLSYGYVGGAFGCYTHQIYDEAFFAAYGYASLVDGCSTYDATPTCGAVILGSGDAAIPAPEPSAVVLLVGGLLATGICRWQKLKRRL
jgi:hypothetical protein